MNPSAASPIGELLSGNQAIGRGAWEAGVRVACGYPGTPSTEILEYLSRYPEVDCEWSTNEKVALEVAVGASLAGARALATMKHVGLNVAADPLFSVAYMGVCGGLVVVSADDPGMHSSQNEQDNRLLARAARIALLEPSTAQEAKDFSIAAFELSENFDTPVMLRTTTRISHGKGSVVLGARSVPALRPYRKNVVKNVVLPAHGRIHHRQMETQRLPALEREAARWAQVFPGAEDLAIITAGSAFLYAQEAFPNASILKLGMTHPLPREMIVQFARGKARVLVIEELEPYLEEQVRALGIVCQGKDVLPRYGELSVGLLRQAFLQEKPQPVSVHVPPLPPRPPVLCPGCMHRGVFYALNQLDAISVGDIGCYTLGALAPLSAMDACMNMGASIGMAHGMTKVFSEEQAQRVVAVIGDSTFYHSGITGLINALYNGGGATVVILNNHTTAMTGHQDHPGTGLTLQHKAAHPVDLDSLCKGLGVQHIHHVDPYDLRDIWRGLDEEMRRPEASVVIAEGACVLKEKTRLGEPVRLDTELCTECLACTRVGCPAVELMEGKLRIHPLLCIACTQCQQVCSDCNAGIDIPQVLELVNQQRYAQAFKVLVRYNPFPAVAGRVCPHPCDHEVNALGWPQAQRYAQDYPALAAQFPTPTGKISVRQVERFLGDYGIAQFSGAEFAPATDRPEKVVIIGAGPAGLSAAWHLRRQGFQVTVLEALEEPGGMMRHGIPAFRLPREILNAEINRLRAIGVDLRCGVKVGSDVTFAELETVYDAVVIAVGDAAPQRVDLGIRGAKQGLLYGVNFLRKFNRGQPPELGKQVAVVGGGNTAIDCARAAMRLGAQVTVYYRRTPQEMPAIHEEIEAAIQEGVRFEYLNTPTRLIVENGRVQGLNLVHMQQGPAEEGRRAQPMPIPGSDFQVQADAVILAIGEEADLRFLKRSAVGHDHKVYADFTGATDHNGVFACGDVAFGYGTVTQGIGTGARVAESVARFLNAKRKAP